MERNELWSAVTVSLPESANHLIFQTYTFPPTQHVPCSLRYALCHVFENFA